jgi:hypothetical protein
VQDNGGGEDAQGCNSERTMNHEQRAMLFPSEDSVFSPMRRGIGRGEQPGVVARMLLDDDDGDPQVQAQGCQPGAVTPLPVLSPESSSLVVRFDASGGELLRRQKSRILVKGDGYLPKT